MTEPIPEPTRIPGDRAPRPPSPARGATVLVLAGLVAALAAAVWFGRAEHAAGYVAALGLTAALSAALVARARARPDRGST